MAKATTKIYGPALVATGPTTIYTVPASTTAFVRTLHISNPSASPVTFTLSIGTDAASTRIYSSYSIPAAGAGVADSVQIKYLNQALAAADTIQVAAGTNNILVIMITADLLTVG